MDFKKSIGYKDYNIFIFDSLDSSNSYVLENHENLESKTVVIAKHQTKGKGRLGKSWQSLANQGLSMSILLKVKNVKADEIKNFSTLTLMTGLAVIDGIKKYCKINLEIGLKWVNDIVYDKKKLGGILVESKIFENEIIFAIGIGINLNQNKDFFIDNDLLNAVSLKTIINKDEIDIEKIASRIIESFDSYYNIFISKGFNSLVKEYNENCVNIGRYVEASFNGEKVDGKALEVDVMGNLVIEKNEKIYKINTGVATIRGKNTYY